MGTTFACFNLDEYCPVKTELFIIYANGRESNILLEDFNTRTGQEYKPCDLLVGLSREKQSFSFQFHGSDWREEE